MMTQIIQNTEQCGMSEIHYLEAGMPDKKDILLLHGKKFSARTWKDLGTLKILAENGFHAIAVDMPGFGGSPEGDMPPGQVLEKFISRKKCDKPVIVGPSMGGRISLEFSLDHPELVGGLVLVGSVGVVENKEKLARIKVPTLIVWGEKDTVSPIANGHLLNESIQGSSFVAIKDAPHPCYIDQPEIWHRELTRFLETV